MRPLRTRLQEAQQRLGFPWEGLERAYLLPCVLADIGQVPVLRDTLVFKGGTALRKCCFAEDLDFPARKEVPTGKGLERLIGESGKAAVRLLDEYASVMSRRPGRSGSARWCRTCLLSRP